MSKKPKILNPTVTMTPSQFLSLLFPAYRYTISSRSCSNGYVRDYWNIIRANPGALPPERLAFQARDIRMYISERMQWHANMHIDGTSNDRNTADAYTLLVKHLIAHPGCDPKQTEFWIDCTKATVEAKPWVPKPPRRDTDGEIIHQPSAYDPAEEHSYVVDYIRFANCLDRQHVCTCEDDGKTETRRVVESPSLVWDWNEKEHRRENPRWEMEWVCADHWDCRPIPEHIKSITPVTENKEP